MFFLDCLKSFRCSQSRIQFRRCIARTVTDRELVGMSLQLDKIARLGENLFTIAFCLQRVFSEEFSACLIEKMNTYSSTFGRIY